MMKKDKTASQDVKRGTARKKDVLCTTLEHKKMVLAGDKMFYPLRHQPGQKRTVINAPILFPERINIRNAIILFKNNILLYKIKNTHNCHAIPE